MNLAGGAVVRVRMVPERAGALHNGKCVIVLLPCCDGLAGMAVRRLGHDEAVPGDDRLLRKRIQEADSGRRRRDAPVSWGRAVLR